MGASLSARAVAALEAIERLGSEDLSSQRTIEEVVHRIVGVIETDAFFAGATDPDTGLCLGAGMVYNLAEEVCHPFWEHEFLIPDYNKFADLTQADPVGDLRQATGGKLSRSAPYASGMRWMPLSTVASLHTSRSLRPVKLSSANVA